MKSYYFEFHTIPLVDELVEKGRERDSISLFSKMGQRERERLKNFDKKEYYKIKRLTIISFKILISWNAFFFLSPLE